MRRFFPKTTRKIAIFSFLLAIILPAQSVLADSSFLDLDTLSNAAAIQTSDLPQDLNGNFINLTGYADTNEVIDTPSQDTTYPLVLKRGEVWTAAAQTIALSGDLQNGAFGVVINVGPLQHPDETAITSVFAMTDVNSDFIVPGGVHVESRRVKTLPGGILTLDDLLKNTQEISRYLAGKWWLNVPDHCTDTGCNRVYMRTLLAHQDSSGLVRYDRGPIEYVEGNQTS